MHGALLKLEGLGIVEKFQVAALEIGLVGFGVDGAGGCQAHLLVGRDFDPDLLGNGARHLALQN